MDSEKQNAHERKQNWTERECMGSWPKKENRQGQTYNGKVRGNSKVETEALLCAGQEKTIRTSFVHHNIGKIICNIVFLECVS